MAELVDALRSGRSRDPPVEVRVFFSAPRKGKNQKPRLENQTLFWYYNHTFIFLAGVAQLVERDLAKVEVVGSSPIARSKIKTSAKIFGACFFMLQANLFLRGRFCRNFISLGHGLFLGRLLLLLGPYVN